VSGEATCTHRSLPVKGLFEGLFEGIVNEKFETVELCTTEYAQTE